ncbi:MAG: polymer-forming cytoskeletal protein [Parabacteroides sp.]
MIGMKHKEDPSSGGGLHNTLASGTIVRGNIVADTDFRLDGKVEGDVHCNGKIVIGPKGRVTGNIIAQNAEILGEVEGSVLINERLVLKSTSTIKGDITTQVLEIEPNAHFNGVCKMGQVQQALAAPKSK